MLRNQVTDPLFPQCPVRNVLVHVGEKWALLVLLTLDTCQRPLRYKEIRNAIPDISQKMLTVTLRELQANGIVCRKAYAEVPPRVEYSLTERASTLMPHIHGLVDWALDNMSDIMNSRKKQLEQTDAVPV